jgi:hypothetical protein
VPRELIEKITTETNNYATKCIEEKPDPKWKPTNVTEILAFIGLHVVMSVIPVGCLKCHCSENICKVSQNVPFA